MPFEIAAKPLPTEKVLTKRRDFKMRLFEVLSWEGVRINVKRQKIPFWLS